jgi:predicted nuclease with TOPRIM domain
MSISIEAHDRICQDLHQQIRSLIVENAQLRAGLASLQEQNTELDRKLAELSERRLTDEVIADIWHANGGFHHHFARAIERWLKGQA